MNRRENKFSGNILLYDYLSAKRAPVLLNRNLTRALQIHRYLSEKGDRQELSRGSHKLRSVWEPPTWDALDEMVDREKSRGSFILEVHGIRSAKANRVTQRNEPAKKTRVLLRAKSVMQVAVFSPLSDLPCLSIPDQGATLQSTDRDIGGAVTVDTQRLIINPDSLSDNHHQSRTNDAFRMNISINIDSQNNAEELYNHLGLPPASSQDISTRLSTTWANILKCPNGKIALPLRDWKGALDLGLEVTMYWTSVAGDSILTTYNRHLRAQEQPDRGLIAPSVSQTSESTLKLIFVYADETITRYSLVCPHESCERRKPTDIEDLKMHLNSWHDYFNYKATQEPDENGNETWRFTCEVSDHRDRAEQRASANADEPLDVRIIPPPEAFNHRRYLNDGDDDYLQKARVNKNDTAAQAAVTVPISAPGPSRRKPPEQVKDMPMRERKRHPVPGAPPGITFFRSVSKRPLTTGECISESDDEVDDSWVKLRRLAEINKVENLSKHAKRFLERFDSHMWDEHVQSEIHVGDSLIRFARQHRDWILQQDVFITFKIKVDEMLQDNIIPEEVHAGCLDIVEAAKPNQIEEAQDISQRLADLEVRQMSHDSLYDDLPPMRTRNSQERTLLAGSIGRPKGKTSNKGKGKARVTDTGHLTPITADSDGDLEMREAALSTETINTDQDTSTSDTPPYDLCLCGEDALVSSRTSPLLACSSMVSKRLTHVMIAITDNIRTVSDATSTMTASKTGGKSYKLLAL